MTTLQASTSSRTKWNSPTRKYRVGEAVLLKEDGLVPTKWPMAKIVSVHPGKRQGCSGRNGEDRYQDIYSTSHQNSSVDAPRLT